MRDAKAEPSVSAAMLSLATGAWVSQAIYVAAKLGIADLLQEGNKACGAIAEATNTHPGALYRLLRALASLDVFAEDAEGRFGLTPLADSLRTTAPGSLRAFAIMVGEPESWAPWGEFLYSVRTGRCAFENVFGAPFFRYMAEHRDATRIYDESMTSRSAAENQAILAAYDFSNASLVIDLGGGQGALLASILKDYSRTKGLLFELPHVIETARNALRTLADSGRSRFVAGDFFEDALPGGGDVYLLKKVIHDWDDEKARTILGACRRAMPRTARLLLIEPMILPGNDPSFAKWLDLFMLVWTSGRERMEEEHTALLASAGFEVRRIVPTNSPVSIIEASPL